MIKTKIVFVLLVLFYGSSVIVKAQYSEIQYHSLVLENVSRCVDAGKQLQHHNNRIDSLLGVIKQLEIRKSDETIDSAGEAEEAHKYNAILFKQYIDKRVVLKKDLEQCEADLQHSFQLWRRGLVEDISVMEKKYIAMLKSALLRNERIDHHLNKNQELITLFREQLNKGDTGIRFFYSALLEYDNTLQAQKNVSKTVLRDVEKLIAKEISYCNNDITVRYKSMVDKVNSIDNTLAKPLVSPKVKPLTSLKADALKAVNQELSHGPAQMSDRVEQFFMFSPGNIYQHYLLMLEGLGLSYSPEKWLLPDHSFDATGEAPCYIDADDNNEAFRRAAEAFWKREQEKWEALW